jgi:hypothetical protein
MNRLVSALALAIMGLAALPARACTSDQVTIIDFRPVMNANSDGADNAMEIDGSLDNFCPTATDAVIEIFGLDKDGKSLGRFKTVTIDNIPAGGKSFEISNVEYTPNVASYQLTVEDTSPVSAAVRAGQATGTGANNAATNGGIAANAIGNIAAYYPYRRY